MTEFTREIREKIFEAHESVTVAVREAKEAAFFAQRAQVSAECAKVFLSEIMDLIRAQDEAEIVKAQMAGEFTERASNRKRGDG